MFKQEISKIKKHITKGRGYLDEVIDTDDSAKAKRYLSTADSEFKMAVHDITNLCKVADNESLNRIRKSASGTVGMFGNKWLHLRLEMTLPSDKNRAEVKRLSNTVSNLLDYFAGHKGYLPQYEWAFVAIVEHINPDKDISVYDHDNKGYRAIPNAMKGRIFEDDNQFNISLGLFTIDDNDAPCCDVYVVPMSDIADFAADYLIF